MLNSTKLNDLLIELTETKLSTREILHRIISRQLIRKKKLKITDVSFYQLEYFKIYCYNEVFLLNGLLDTIILYMYISYLKEKTYQFTI